MYTELMPRRLMPRRMNGMTVVSSLKPPASPMDAMLPPGLQVRVSQPSSSPPTLSTAPPQIAFSSGRVPISTSPR